MKVKDLIQQLQGEDPEKDVFIAYQYGDYARTTACERVNEVEELPVAPWEYANRHKLLEDDSEDEIEHGDAETAVVLQA